MMLDLSAIATQIQAMAAGVDGARDAARFAALRRAWRDLDSDTLNHRLREANTTFRASAAGSDFQRTAPLPGPVTDYSVVASDGSFILPNRHAPARYWLLNLGVTVLRYGAEPSADLWSSPDLHYQDDELFVPDDIYQIPINGTVLSPKRAADELAAAVDALDRAAPPAVVLQDGTLILSELESMQESIVQWALPRFLSALRHARDQDVPVASYISSPGASELVGALRVSICDYPTQGRSVDCTHCRRRISSEGHTPACDILPPVTDQWLLREVAGLRPGERTTTFGSTLRVLERYRAEDPDFDIRYFYMHNGWEIGRVEVPRWVAEDQDQLDLVHWVLHDQSQLGLGYPLALQEAHELAVLSMIDRRLIEDAVERALADANVAVTYQGKAGSKRVRAI
jgi:hypothetical protein